MNACVQSFQCFAKVDNVERPYGERAKPACVRRSTEALLYKIKKDYFEL